MLHHLYTRLTGHMLIFVMFYLVYFTNYPRVDGINCASGFQANNDGIRSRKCTTGVQHCLITLSRDSINEVYNPHSFDCWPWPELENRCPTVGGVCHVLHKSKDDLLKTCCCHGHMCNNETVKIVPMAEDISLGEFHRSGLDHFGLRVPDRDSNVIVAPQDLPNSGVVSSLHSDSYEDPPDDRLQIHALRIFVICGVLFSTVCTVILLVFCLSPRYKKVRMKFSLACKHPPSSSYYQSGLDNRVRGTLSIIDCFHCPKRLSFKSSYAGDCVMTYPVQDPETTHHSISNGDNLPRGASCTDSIGSGFVFSDVSESGSIATEVTNLQLVAKCCQKEKLIGRGRFAEVWLASVPLSVITNQMKITNDLLDQSNHKNNHSNGIKPSQSTNGSLLGNNSNTNSSWHLFCCQSDNRFKTVSSTAVKRNDSNTSSLFRESHPQISLNYLCSEKDQYSQSKISSKECFDPEDLHLTETTSRLLLSSAIASSNVTNNSSVNGHSITDECPMLVAVKTFTPNEFDAWKTELGIFKAIHSHIGHPNIVLLLGAGSVQLCQPLVTEYRLVMEFTAGGSLRQLLSSGSWLSFSHVLKISDDIVQGLGFLHMAHRDLKPENILIRFDGSVCLSDFGQSVCLTEISPSSPVSNNSCRTSSQDVLTTTYSVSSALESMPKAGTLRYQAPEIIDGAISFTGWALLRTDIYSLGLILWELLTAVCLPVVCEKTLEEDYDVDKLDLKLIEPVLSINSSVGSDLYMMNDLHSELDHLNYETNTVNVNYHTPEHRKMKKRHHWLPYEKELGSFCNSSAALQQLVCVEKYRPTSHPLWCNSSLITHFHRTISECWDHDPEARLTADCILKRIRSLNTQLARSKNSA
ncbi:unnamed protein product [Heterobilharzia americana]|nr:unnamed protein product [Heterobilharzia americana]